MLEWSKLKNPVLSYEKTDPRDPCAVYHEGKFYVYFTHHLRPPNWLPVSVWVTDMVTTDDFRTYSEPRRIAPSPYCSPGNVFFHDGYWYMPLQYYGEYPEPANLCIMKSKNLVDWSTPVTILTWTPQHKWSNNRLIDPFIIRRNDGKFFLYYSGHEHKDDIGAQHFGYAVFNELTGWEDKSLNEPVLRADRDYELLNEPRSGIENNTILFKDGLYYMVYSAGMKNQRMAMAVSPDLIRWEKKGPVSLPVEAWSETQYGAPYIMDGKEWGDTHYYMLYQGKAAAGREAVSIGIARSTDLFHWEVPA